MSTTECGTEIKLVHQPAVETRLGSVVQLVILRGKSAWRAIRNRLASNALNDLDDYQLDDIGLSRRDVTQALDRSGVLQDPSLLLSKAARERARYRFARRAGH
jgi:uncharacterized protein YjiS (DUF1127 family)